MLSETPANNQFIDLRNQLALARKIIIKKKRIKFDFLKIFLIKTEKFN